MNPQSVIQATNLSMDYRIGKRWLNVINDVSLQIRPLEIHGLVGESGSGKSTVAMALMHYLAPNALITGGEIVFDGENLVQKSPAELRHIWGKKIGYVPQNPLAALNPSLKIGEQMAELTRLHIGITQKDAMRQAVGMLGRVKIADSERIVHRYPHQLSGGMQQRVMIAMALSVNPRLLILDEPTTALDVTTQAVILDLFRELIMRESSAALYVSHNLSAVAQFCDTVTVLYGGEVMETARVNDLYTKPVHPYTIGLLSSLPAKAHGTETRLSTIDGAAPSLQDRPLACVFAPRCPVATVKCHTEKPPLEQIDRQHTIRCWRWTEITSGQIYPMNKPQGKTPSAPPRSGYVLNVSRIHKTFGDASIFDRVMGRSSTKIQAVADVSIRVNARATVGIVGESGSGKTTVARAIVGLDTADSGEIELCGVPISNQLSKRPIEALRNLRMVSQNPHDALNPYRTIGQALTRTIRLLGDKRMSMDDIQKRIIQLLESVGLTSDYRERFPNQLSGGEKQRAAIARAFAAQPALIIADEPTSSLDVSVQAVILNLLKDLRAQEGASYLFISHDLEVITYLADWIVVMYLGQVVEEGSVEQVYNFPSHPYTEALISAIPEPNPMIKREHIHLDGEIPSPRNRPSGCSFHTRCPRKIGSVCEQQSPPLRDAGDGHVIRCHIPLDDLRAVQTVRAENGR